MPENPVALLRQPAPMPDFSEAVDTQARYEMLQAYRQQQIQTATDNAAIGAALDQHRLKDGSIDYDAAISSLATHPTAIAKFLPLVDKHRQEVGTAIKTELDNNKALRGHIAQLSNSIIDAIDTGDLATATARLNSARQLAGPDGAKLLPQDLSTPEAVAAVRTLHDGVLTADQQAKAKSEAFDLYSNAGTNFDQKYKALTQGLAAINPQDPTMQDQWHTALAHARMDTVPADAPPEVRQAFDAYKQRVGALPPDASQAAIAQMNQLGVTPEQRAQSAAKVIDQRIAQQNADAATYRAQHPAPASASGDRVALTPDGLENMATRWRILGDSAIPTRFDDNDKKAIINAATAQLKTLGQSPAMAAQKQAAYKSDAASLTQMTKMVNTATAFETKALAQTGIISELSPQVGRTASPILNGWLLAGKKEIAGDSHTAQLFNAITTFAAEYAKIMEGSTGSVAASSDSARKASSDLIKATMNPQTLQDVVGLMKREMRLTIDGYGAVIEHITTKMGGGETGTGRSGEPPPAGKVEEWVIGADGKLHPKGGG